MIRRPLLPAAQAVLAALWLGGCVGAFPAPPATADLTGALIPRSGPTPPDLPSGACWVADVTPAIVETVTEQVQATPERRDAAGRPITPASFRTETRQRIVADRREVWFRTLCGDELTPDRIATLQRALKARGLFGGPLTGLMDGATRSGIRAWQRPRGLDSDTLSRAAAEALGVVAVPRAGY